MPTLIQGSAGSQFGFDANQFDDRDVGYLNIASSTIGGGNMDDQTLQQARTSIRNRKRGEKKGGTDTLRGSKDPEIVLPKIGTARCCEAARSIVLLRQGYDVINLTGNLTSDIFNSAIDELSGILTTATVYNAFNEDLFWVRLNMIEQHADRLLCTWSSPSHASQQPTC